MTTKSSIRRWGVLYKSGVYARTVLRLTLGDLDAVRPRAHAHGELSEGRPEPIGLQKSAKGIVGTSRPEGPNGSRQGLKERGRGPLRSGEMTSGEVLGSPSIWDELAAGAPGANAPVGVHTPPRLHLPNRRIRDPYVRWCGRGEAVRPLPIPIRR